MLCVRVRTETPSLMSKSGLILITREPFFVIAAQCASSPQTTLATCLNLETLFGILLFRTPSSASEEVATIDVEDVSAGDARALEGVRKERVAASHPRIPVPQTYKSPEFTAITVILEPAPTDEGTRTEYSPSAASNETQHGL